MTSISTVFHYRVFEKIIEIKKLMRRVKKQKVRIKLSFKQSKPYDMSLCSFITTNTVNNSICNRIWIFFFVLPLFCLLHLRLVYKFPEESQVS